MCVLTTGEYGRWDIDKKKSKKIRAESAVTECDYHRRVTIEMEIIQKFWRIKLKYY